MSIATLKTKNIKAGSDKMENIPSMRFQTGLYCITWEENGELYMIWSPGLDKMVTLYFKLNKHQNLLYVTPEGKKLIIFGRKK